MTEKQVHAAIDVFLVSLPVKYCDMLHHFFCIRHNHYQTSQSYSSAARSSIQKFDNDCDVIFV